MNLPDDGEHIRSLHGKASALVQVAQGLFRTIGEILIGKRAELGPLEFPDWLAAEFPLPPADVSIYMAWATSSTEQMMAGVETLREQNAEAGNGIVFGNATSLERLAQQINEALAASVSHHLRSKETTIAAGHWLLDARREIGSESDFQKWRAEYITTTPARAEAAMTFARCAVPAPLSLLDAALLENRVDAQLAALNEWPADPLDGELDRMARTRLTALFNENHARSGDSLEASREYLCRAATFARGAHDRMLPEDFEAWAATLKIPREQLDSMIHFEK